MRRREFLAGSLAGAGWLAALPGAAWGQALTAEDSPATYFVPGYRPDLAHYRGRPLLEAPEFQRQIPSSYGGELTLLTRIDERDGSLRRALMPIRGHAVSLSPDGRIGFWNNMNRQTQISFDPATLELIALRSLKSGFAGGGHGIFTTDGAVLIATERRSYESYQGDPAKHEGRLTLRDPASLRAIESYGCGGMAPHDLCWMADGRHIAVANYGSITGADSWRPDIHAPSVSIVDAQSGKTVERYPLTEPGLESRHLAAGSSEILAATVRRGSMADFEALFADGDQIYRPDPSSGDGGAYLPAPLWRVGSGLLPLPDPLDGRNGQTVIYDPDHRRFLATFAGSDKLAIIPEGAPEAISTLDLAAWGLRQPRGVALHPDGLHYAVSGSWADILLLRRDDLELAAERRIAVDLFDHSHMTLGRAL